MDDLKKQQQLFNTEYLFNSDNINVFVYRQLSETALSSVSNAIVLIQIQEFSANFTLI